MKSDDLFRDDLGRSSAEESQASGRAHHSGAGLSAPLRAIIVIAALAAAGLVLYGILQVFVCDFREVVFKGMSRRAVWLCR
jgi:hypothetical protein